MNTTVMRWACAAVLIALLSAGPVFGEVTVSVTINGPIQEILPVLQRLKDMGVGSAPAATKDALKLEMQSVATPAPGPAIPPLPPPPPPKPTLGLLNPKVDPGTVKPGQNFLVSVKVSDPDHLVDTVAATIVGMAGSIDLYDNGTHGDANAGDGIWSCNVTAAPQLAAGEHVVTITAFNKAGSPVMSGPPDKPPAPLTTHTVVTVAP